MYLMWCFGVVLSFSFSDDELIPSQFSQAPVTPPPPSPEPIRLPTPPSSPLPYTPLRTQPAQTSQFAPVAIDAASHERQQSPPVPLTPGYAPQSVTMTTKLKPETPPPVAPPASKRPMFAPELDLMQDVNRFSLPKLKSVKRTHSHDRPKFETKQPRTDVLPPRCLSTHAPSCRLCM